MTNVGDWNNKTLVQTDIIHRWVLSKSQGSFPTCSFSVQLCRPHWTNKDGAGNCLCWFSVGLVAYFAGSTGNYGSTWQREPICGTHDGIVRTARIRSSSSEIRPKHFLGDVDSACPLTDVVFTSQRFFSLYWPHWAEVSFIPRLSLFSPGFTLTPKQLREQQVSLLHFASFPFWSKLLMFLLCSPILWSNFNRPQPISSWVGKTGNQMIHYPSANKCLFLFWTVSPTSKWFTLKGFVSRNQKRVN